MFVYAPLQFFSLCVAQTQSWHSQRGPKNFPGSDAWHTHTPQSHLPLPLQMLPSGVRQRRREDSVESRHTPATWLINNKEDQKLSLESSKRRKEFSFVKGCTAPPPKKNGCMGLLYIQCYLHKSQFCKPLKPTSHLVAKVCEFCEGSVC